MGIGTRLVIATAVLTAVSILLASVALSNAEDGSTRVASDFPFSADAPVNTSIGADAVYESTTDTSTAAFLGGSPEFNSPNWTVSVTHADSNDPLAKIRDPESGEVRATARIPKGSVTSDPPRSKGGDSWFAAIQPDGHTVVESYGMTRVSDTRFTSTYVETNDLRGSGINSGTRASGTSLLMGLIRQADIDQGKIAHALAMTIPNEMLRAGFVWPARQEDGDAAESYTGPIPMGSMFAIPPGIDVNSLGLGTDGLMLAKALQDYGAYVVARSETVALMAETSADPPRVANLRTAWKQVLYGLMRRVTNNSATNIGGGGPRRQPSLHQFA